MSDRSTATKQGRQHGYEDGYEGRLAVPREDISHRLFVLELSVAYSKAYYSAYERGQKQRLREAQLREDRDREAAEIDREK